jgi:Putative peptidoglycan binding domain
MSCVCLIRGLRWAGACGLICIAVQVAALADAGASAKRPADSASAKTASKQHTVASSKTHKGKSSRSKSKGSKKRGQQAIDAERSRQIQEALIREHYMEGQPSGKWDDATQAALRRFQAAQGWQSKTVPDSRALIKLGLGPSHEHLLNPESAMTTGPFPPSAKADSKPAATDTSATAPPAEPASGSKPQHYHKF